MHVNDLMELSESRRNPHLNPRIQALDSFSMYARNPNMFVTYTELPKIGINPKSSYDTPIGIYSYPLGYVLERAYRIGSVFGATPFASQSKFVHLFEQSSQKILDFSNYSNSDYNNDKQLLIRYFSQMVSFEEVKEAIRDHEYSAQWNRRDARGGKNIWNLIYFLIAKYTNTQQSIEATRLLFRVLGYDAVYDMDGMGTIHHNEPTQAVHFNVQTIKVVDTFENNEMSSDRQEARRDLVGVENLAEMTDDVERKHKGTITKIKQLSEALRSVDGYDERVFGVVDDFVETFKSYTNYLTDLYRVIKLSESKLLNMTPNEVEVVVSSNAGSVEDIVTVADVFSRESTPHGGLNEFRYGFKRLLSDDRTTTARGIVEMRDSSKEISFWAKLVSDSEIREMIMKGLIDNNGITVRDEMKYKKSM